MAVGRLEHRPAPHQFHSSIIAEKLVSVKREIGLAPRDPHIPPRVLAPRPVFEYNAQQPKKDAFVAGITDVCGGLWYIGLGEGAPPPYFCEGFCDMRSERTIRILMLSVLVTTLVLGAYGAGIGTMWLFTHDRLPSSDEQAQFGLFWEAWHLVEGNYLGDLPDMQHLSWGAIRGALATLDDPHTTFLEPQPRQRERERLEGKFGGIGAYVSQNEEGRILLDPMPDLPAERAGVQTDDILIRVDDTDITSEMTLDEVINLIKGEVGTMVRLVLQRQGATGPVVVDIERQEIPTPSVEWRMLEGAEGLGYVRITIFGGRTRIELREALDELRKEGMERLILDLRGNGGGFLDAAVDVASEFLSDGVVLYQITKEEAEQAFKVKNGGRFTDPPLVVLVDGGTASASEIVAGALQDRGRAPLIGEKTYGKGSVQSVFDLSDGSSVHVTSARWLTPNRRLIDGEGLTPDVQVSITDQDRSEGRDAQLERAIDYVVHGQ